MENFFKMITDFVNVIAKFFKDLFGWKEGPFDEASDAISEYVSEKAAEKETQGE